MLVPAKTQLSTYHHHVPTPMNDNLTPPRELSPIDAIAHCADHPLVALISAGGSHGRWSIVAHPREYHIIDARSRDPLSELERFTSASRLTNPPSNSQHPFVGGWIVALSYHLGHVIEPATRFRHDRSPSHLPLIELWRCPGAWLHDAHDNRWHAIGEVTPWKPFAEHHVEPGFECSDPVSTVGEAGYIAAVTRGVEYIHAGDVFQVNLAHPLSARFSGSPRELAATMFRRAGPSFGAYLESWQDASVTYASASISPELFLDVDLGTRRVITRPIKGTRLVGDDSHTQLDHSEKDAAELAMIVDLMRNDLGRVCRFGSVRVSDPRSIDRHGPSAGALHHASATVEGTMQDNVTIADLLRATFPPGSVTGAPKIRAMQIIDELESFNRGLYCGCIGYISDHGRATFNVAIRTATLTCNAGSMSSNARGELVFPVGAGIVADSDPQSEWRETLDKAQMFMNAVTQREVTR